MKRYLLIAAFLLGSLSAGAESEQIRVKPPFDQDIDVRFRLFPTENIFTFLAVDTMYGSVYQVQYSIGEKGQRGFVPITDSSIIPSNQPSKIGRFTLFETHNMYSFILVDQSDGRLWQVQWGPHRGIAPILPLQ